MGRKEHTLLDSLRDLGGSGGVGDVTVLLGWVYLVGVDVLVGVGVVDLEVRLFYIDRRRWKWEDREGWEMTRKYRVIVMYSVMNEGAELTESGNARSTDSGAAFWTALGTAD